ncbi:MAG: TatD family hydrolase [Acidobacteriota bacterium]|nr:TatD family hydrolase [Acidobacteriota bacterium]
MIDSHCHLAGEEFAADLDAVVARAVGAGVTTAVCILGAGDEAESARAAVVRKAWPGIRFASGIHPHHAGEFAGEVNRAVETVRKSVDAEGACAIGEIGLDYHYDLSPRRVQQEIFRAQVATARELRLPIAIHTREAAEDTFQILREEGAGDVRGVFHCFTGDSDMARAALELGFYLSFAGIVTFPRAAALHEAAKLTPAGRLLGETDAPYLAPVPFRGRRNEPAHVARIYEALATVRDVPVEDLIEQVNANFGRLFTA